MMRVEVPDRPGLLTDLVQTLRIANVSVVAASITTRGATAVDVFKITDQGTGGKVSAEKFEALRRGVAHRARRCAISQSLGAAPQGVAAGAPASPPSAADMDDIDAACASLPPFVPLLRRERNAIYAHMHRFRYPPGVVIISEGEEVQQFFVLVGPPKHLGPDSPGAPPPGAVSSASGRELHPGSVLGELGIVQSALATDTWTASPVSGCDAFAVDRRRLHTLLHSLAGARRAQAAGALGALPMLAGLSKGQLYGLVDVCRRVEARQGDSLGGVFLAVLVEGSAVVGDRGGVHRPHVSAPPLSPSAASPGAPPLFPHSPSLLRSHSWERGAPPDGSDTVPQTGGGGAGADGSHLAASAGDAVGSACAIANGSDPSAAASVVVSSQTAELLTCDEATFYRVLGEPAALLSPGARKRAAAHRGALAAAARGAAREAVGELADAPALHHSGASSAAFGLASLPIAEEGGEEEEPVSVSVSVSVSAASVSASAEEKAAAAEEAGAVHGAAVEAAAAAAAAATAVLSRAVAEEAASHSPRGTGAAPSHPPQPPPPPGSDDALLSVLAQGGPFTLGGVDARFRNPNGDVSWHGSRTAMDALDTATAGGSSGGDCGGGAAGGDAGGGGCAPGAAQHASAAAAAAAQPPPLPHGMPAPLKNVLQMGGRLLAGMGIALPPPHGAAPAPAAQQQQPPPSPRVAAAAPPQTVSAASGGGAAPARLGAPAASLLSAQLSSAAAPHHHHPPPSPSLMPQLPPPGSAASAAAASVAGALHTPAPAAADDAPPDAPPGPSSAPSRAGVFLGDGGDAKPGAASNGAWKLSLALPDFHIGPKLGEGLTGRVHYARLKVRGGECALKVMRKARLVELGEEHHVRSELQALGALSSSPFVTQLLGAFQDAQAVYLAIEYMRGPDLFAFMHEINAPQGFERCVPLASVRFYTAQVLLGLDALHRAGYVYRDLKPENILMDGDGNLKLADLGFAKLTFEGGRAYTVCGTPDYLAPEVIEHRGATRGSDYWALGILIFEFIAGFPPFQGEPKWYQFKKICAGVIDYWPERFPPDAADVVQRLLQADESRRLGLLAGGVGDIQGHPFYAALDWDALASKTLVPPFKPSEHEWGQATCSPLDSKRITAELKSSASSPRRHPASRASAVADAPQPPVSPRSDAARPAHQHQSQRRVHRLLTCRNCL